MPTISTLVVAVRADIKQFQAGMAQAEAQTVGATNGMSAGMQKFGMLAAAGAGIAAVAVVKFASDAVDAASDLHESINKVQVVFGSSSKQVIDWSETMASSFGISQQAALESAGTFGNLFDAMGLVQKAGTEMSTTLVELAADLASFNNASPEDVLKAMQSGLTGQIRPLRQYGIEISEAALKQEALAQGITKSTSEMTMAEKVQLRYALILKQTGNAQGDFARTSDGLANQQRILAAQWDDLKAALGTALLPVVVSLTHAFNDLATVLIFAASGFDDFNDKVKEAALNVGQAEAGLGGMFTKFLTGNPIVKAGADIWDAFRGSQDKAIESTSHVQQQLDGLNKTVAKTGDELSHFAHMTAKDFNAWRADSVAALNGVSGSLDMLADKAHLTADKILGAFERQLKAMANYQDNWETLLKRGLPDSLAQQLQEMGLQGASIVAALANANEQKFNHIINDWQQAQREAAQTANMIAGIGNALNNLPRVTTLDLFINTHGTGHPLPHAQGGGFVERSGVAVIHKGEHIIPANGGAGGVNITINGDVTGEEIVRKVRDGLLKLGARNATTGL